MAKVKTTPRRPTGELPILPQTRKQRKPRKTKKVATPTVTEDLSGKFKQKEEELNRTIHKKTKRIQKYKKFRPRMVKEGDTYQPNHKRVYYNKPQKCDKNPGYFKVRGYCRKPARS